MALESANPQEFEISRETATLMARIERLERNISKTSGPVKVRLSRPRMSGAGQDLSA
jgi:hypothetical protein